MQVCTSSQTTTPTSHHSVFYRPDALPAAQLTQVGHSPGKPGIVREFNSGQGKVRGKG